MGATGRAAIFFGSGKPFELIEYPVLDPGPGEVLARLDYTSICGSDVHYWRGEDPVMEDLAANGLLLGHETVGHVERLGSGVTTDSAGQPLAEGDPIVFAYFRPCGRCRACTQGRVNACETVMGGLLRPPSEPPHFVGAFADYYHLRRGQYVLKLPDGMTPEHGISANCAAAQSWMGLLRGGVGPGERVVVQGAGGLGLYAVAAAKRMGAGQVVAVDAMADRLAAATALGADATVDVTEFGDPAGRVDRVRELTGGGADVVLEVAGVPGVVDEGVRMLARGGRYIEMGQITRGSDVFQVPALALLMRNISLVGVALYAPQILRDVVGMLGDLRADPVITRLGSGRRYPLEDIDAAFADAVSHRSAERPVLDLAQGGPA
ncbi:zinc-binding dehydrogenase [Pseudonocardia sp. RS010]|uniref:zinc-binding dehydrogenase n=1 Tax=Pseudonocardia sp. RS010 TaxID=3385979 RepID=UPI0039A177D9